VRQLERTKEVSSDGGAVEPGVAVRTHDVSLSSHGGRDCCEGAMKSQTWQVGVRTSSRALVNEGGAHKCPGHNWLLKCGDVPGSMSCVEKESKLTDRKLEEYKGTRFQSCEHRQISAIADASAGIEIVISAG